MSATPEIAYLYKKTLVSVERDGIQVPVISAGISEAEVVHVITAWNPGDERPDADMNDAADVRLRSLLEARSLAPIRARGSDPHSAHYEESWLVHGLSDNEARSIGEQFGQVGVFRFANSRQTVLACTDDWSVTRSLYDITSNDIVVGNRAFNAGGLRSWKWFVEQLPNGPDLTQTHHRHVLFRFLNRWGCRLEKGVGQSESLTEMSLESWWAKWGSVVSPAIRRPLEEWSVGALDALADSYWDLQSRPGGSRRSIGPTAASKVFLALAPEYLPAWDRTIARHLYGGTSRDCYWAHLASAAKWSETLRPHQLVTQLFDTKMRVGMGKLIDQALYRFLTRT